MLAPDWDQIAAVIAQRATEPGVRSPTALEIKDLVTVHGWEIVGILMEAAHHESTLRVLVKSGVPFDVAVKVMTQRCSGAI